MNKLKKLLDTWYDGKTFRGIKTPPLETIRELIAIYNGRQKTTINSTVVEILDKCKIRYEINGVGWIIFI